MCCYTWCNWLVNDADARCHVDNKKTKQKKTTWITKKTKQKKNNGLTCACTRVHVCGGCALAWVGLRGVGVGKGAADPSVRGCG